MPCWMRRSETGCDHSANNIENKKLDRLREAKSRYHEAAAKLAEIRKEAEKMKSEVTMEFVLRARGTLTTQWLAYRNPAG